MKWIIVTLLTAFLSGCFVFGYTRQMKITLTNESGLEIEKVVIKFFNYEFPAYRGDSIVVKNFQNQKVMDVLYNLEHVEGFSDLSCKVVVKFKETQIPVLERSLFTVDLRRINAKTPIMVTIKSDTLLRNY
ncbi:hypothetical protein FHS57_002111 [Runella defluvii]|uniref:Lipoprotein n=1 Tax=Runella defluvii TaxID=370973 RepID=A0A7W5ZLN6_9BACT|nr:hypothetical protein [Runella defluvii]MBB3838106.1 hypothetical protein [Runella defluvii]